MKRSVLMLLLLALLVVGPPAHFAGASGPAIRMAVLQSDIHQLAFWVALEKGFFTKNGVLVEVAGVFKAGPEIMTAFSAGELDMAYVGEAPATTAVANKAAGVVVVAQVNTEGSALVITKDNTAIKSLVDLKGKLVAIPGHSTVQDFLLRKALKNAGIDPASVNIIVLKPPEMISALRTGQIDAFIAWEPHPSKAATLGVGQNLATSGGMWPGHPCCVLVTDKRFIAKHPEKVRAVVAAHVQATDYIHRNAEDAIAIGIKSTGMDEATVRKAMQNVHFTYEINVEGEKEYVRFLSELGLIRIENPDRFADQFLQPKILRDILRQ
ncbi:MAG: ABC transporter substrate-binding protein [Proteobacteria bacterium]|nr:ABC transporter substrate-binding protein [Pseudomonadota bacterium]MBU1569086.1 ABC transporter substrate-binding protein [Pseudomonadota bacterium]